MPASGSTSPNKPRSRRRATAVSGGGVGIGLLALIGGLVLHGHYEPVKQVCDSGLGALGQALEPSAQSHCSLDSALAELGTVATVIGVVILAGVLLMVVGLLLEARMEAGKPAAPKRKTTTASDAKPATPTRSPDMAAHPTPSKFKIVSTDDGVAVSAQEQDIAKEGGSPRTIEGVDANISSKRT
jgi:hypothetical protein